VYLDRLDEKHLNAQCITCTGSFQYFRLVARQERRRIVWAGAVETPETETPAGGAKGGEQEQEQQEQDQEKKVDEEEEEMDQDEMGEADAVVKRKPVLDTILQWNGKSYLLMSMTRFAKNATRRENKVEGSKPYLN
jgi:hypothetical protein